MTTARLPPWQVWLGGLGLTLMVLLALPFVHYTFDMAVRGLTGALAGESRLFEPGAHLANIAIFGHMVGGGLATLLAPFQLIGWIRRRAPAVHRWSGRVLAGGAAVAGIAGLAYIAASGTVGGWPMDLAFSVSGALTLLTAVMAANHARAGRIGLHREWALRLFVMAMSSWIYRMHYAIWELTTGGIWRADDFSGAFDLANLVAFYLPYLVLVEIIIRRRRAGSRPTG